jgi:tetratricopeptide (TPR) repeat protein
MRATVRFIGRDQDLDQLRRELDTPISLGGAFVLSIAGVGGVGKSSLVRQLLQVRRDAIYVSADDRDRLQSPAALAEIVAQRLAARLGPDSYCARVLADPERAFASDAVAVFSDALVRDVNAAAAYGAQVVLVLDTYEVLRRVAGPWLLDTLLGTRLEPLRGDLRILVSGREPIQRTDRRWISDWAEMIVNIDLEPFSLAETQAFLQAGPVRQTLSPDLVRAAHQTTGGLPLWLGLIGRGRRRLEDLVVGASAEDVQYIVDRFLMWWDDPQQRHWVRIAWIPRWFNIELLRVLLGDDAERAFDWLTHEAALVHGERGRWIFHDVVRSALRQEAQLRAPGELADLHDRLAEYWSRSPSASMAAFNMVYHRLLGRDPLNAVRFVSSTYARALAQRDPTLVLIADAAVVARDEAPSLIGWQPIAEIELHWQAVAAGDIASAAAARDRLLALDVLEPSDRALLLANGLHDRAHSPAVVKASGPRGGLFGWLWPRRSRQPEQLRDVERLIEYGDSLRLAGDYDAALIALTEAVRLGPNYATAWASRGETYRALSRPHAAVEDLTRATRLRSDWSWAWAARAAANLADGAAKKAVADATRAIELDQRSAWALAVRGLALSEVLGGPTMEAVADLRQALHMDPSLTWAQSALEQWGTELGALTEP